MSPASAVSAVNTASAAARTAVSRSPAGARSAPARTSSGSRTTAGSRTSAAARTSAATRAAASRAALTVVAPAPWRPRRAPFVVLSLLVVGVGLLGLLGLNTVLAQDAFRRYDLERQAALLSEQEQQLASEVAALEAPERLAARAAELGLVPAGPPAFLRLSDGAVLGAPLVPVLPPVAVVPTAPAAKPVPASKPAATPRAAVKPSPTPRAAAPKPAPSAKPAPSGKPGQTRPTPSPKAR